MVCVCSAHAIPVFVKADDAMKNVLTGRLVGRLFGPLFDTFLFQSFFHLFHFILAHSRIDCLTHNTSHLQLWAAFSSDDDDYSGDECIS